MFANTAATNAADALLQWAKDFTGVRDDYGGVLADGTAATSWAARLAAFVTVDEATAIKRMWRAVQRGDPADHAVRNARDIDAPVDDSDDKSALQYICSTTWSKVGHHRETIAARLLDMGADVDHRLKDGSTPLWAAAQGGAADLVTMLVENNANFRLERMTDGSTPLWIAAHKGHDAVVERLLAAPGVDVSEYVKQADGDGATPLFMAAHKGHDAVVERLLAAPGVDVFEYVKQAVQDGRTPLFIATRNGHDAVVERLLAAPGMNVSEYVNRAIDNNITPIMVASCFGHAKCVRLLLDHNASLDECMTGKNEIMECGAGSTALSIAEGKGHHDIVAMLKSAP